MERYVKGMKLKLDAYDLYKKVRKDYLKKNPDADRVPSDSDLHKLIYEVYLYGNSRTISQTSTDGTATGDVKDRSAARSDAEQFSKDYNSANELDPNSSEHPVSEPADKSRDPNEL